MNLRMILVAPAYFLILIVRAPFVFAEWLYECFEEGGKDWDIWIQKRLK